jgi:hypothetical protein
MSSQTGREFQHGRAATGSGMRVLIACEFSGVVRDAFIERGHEAVSCDIVPTDRPGPHIQADVLTVVDQRWDAMVAFPPCTHLSKVSARYWQGWQEAGIQQTAAAFFLELAHASIPRIAIENPAGYMSKFWRKPDQYVQPWWFGDPWVKTTGLWLHGLPPLAPTRPVDPRGYWVDGGTMKAAHRHRRLAAGRAATSEGSYSAADRKSNVTRAAARARTFPGLAAAMADQWGSH